MIGARDALERVVVHQGRGTNHESQPTKIPAPDGDHQNHEDTSLTLDSLGSLTPLPPDVTHSVPSLSFCAQSLGCREGIFQIQGENHFLADDLHGGIIQRADIFYKPLFGDGLNSIQLDKRVLG